MNEPVRQDDAHARAQSREADGDERPPFGRTWATLYAAVLVNLVMLIVLFYLLTRTFS